MMNIDMIFVSSSNIESIGYDANSSVLYVRFLGGRMYIYKGVTQLEFDALLNAPSVGTYMNRNIKGCYPYERIE